MIKQNTYPILDITTLSLKTDAAVLRERIKRHRARLKDPRARRALKQDLEELNSIQYQIDMLRGLAA